MSEWYVYILECADGTLYTGASTDVSYRISQHTAGKGAKYTRGRGPFKLLAQRSVGLKSTALVLEAFIKKQPKAKKVQALKDWKKPNEETVKQLEMKIQALKREVRIMQEAAEIRNRELDAMHYVWCDGGCQGGVHRYDGKGPTEINESIVATAERNTSRLRTWWENRKGRLSWQVEVKENGEDKQVSTDPASPGISPPEGG